MALIMDETAGDKQIEGVQGGCAVRRAKKDCIEVWSDDFELHLGNVPADFTPKQITVAIQFFDRGVKSGEEQGRKAVQQEMCRALGLRLA